MAKALPACLLFGLSLSSFAQDVAFVGPVTGWIYDPPSQAVRFISGIPGAARLGAEVVSGISWASIAPNGRTAIVQMNDELRLITAAVIGQDSSSAAPINAVIESPQFSAWAFDSSAVALYSPVSRTVQWIRVNSNAPVAESPIVLTGIDGEVTCFSADPVSGSVVIAVAGSGVYRVTASDGARLIAPAVDISAIAVEPGGRRMWVADRGSAQLVEISDLQSSPTLRTLLVDSERLADITVIALSPDRSELYLADRHTSRLYRFEGSSAALVENTTELPAPATALVPIGRESVLLLGLRAQLSDPVYVLTVSPGLAPTLFFVPDGGGQ